jgi:hypothetical protein
LNYVFHYRKLHHQNLLFLLCHLMVSSKFSVSFFFLISFVNLYFEYFEFVLLDHWILLYIHHYQSMDSNTMIDLYFYFYLNMIDNSIFPYHLNINRSFQIQIKIQMKNHQFFLPHTFVFFFIH